METTQNQLMTDYFTSIENKGKLWTMSLNNGAFNNIDEKYLTHVREIFESSILEINYDNKDKDLMSKNKLFFDNMLSKLMKFKQDSIYTAESIRETKLNKFEQDLAEKQANFDQLISKPQPPMLDLSDPIENNITNIDDLLKQTMSSRNNDELLITQDASMTIASSTEDESILQQILTRLINIEKILQI